MHFEDKEYLSQVHRQSYSIAYCEQKTREMVFLMGLAGGLQKNMRGKWPPYGKSLVILFCFRTF